MPRRCCIPCAAPGTVCVSRIRLRDTTVFRLAMRYAAFFCLLSAGGFALLYGFTTAEMDAQIDAGLRAEMAALTQLYASKGAAGLKDTVAARSSFTSLAASDTGDTGPRQYLLADAGLHTLAGTFANWPAELTGDLPTLTTLDLDLPPNQPGLDEDGPRIHVRVYAVALPGGYRLLVGQALNETDELRTTLLALTIGAVLLTLAVGFLGGVWMGRGVLRRLTQVIQAADTIMAGDLSRRISEEHRRDEFEALAQKLNAMLARIETLMRAQREVTENVAHDLRSPLGRLRARLEGLLMKRPLGDADREALLKAVEETDRLAATLNAVLSIAEIEALSRARWQEMDLVEVCRDVAELYAPLADEKKLRFETSLTGHVPVRGHRQMLAQALSNLLDNAVKYTPPGGRIQLALRAEGGRAVISVADSGPGIPEGLRTRVLERFVRLDESRTQPGNGLGLSLVKAIADHHGAQLELGDNLPGLVVSLRLPLSAPRQQTLSHAA